MSFTLRPSPIDPSLFEVVEEEQVIQEISIRFRLHRWPSRFVSVEEIRKWVESEERRLAKRAAYRLLSARGQASAELKSKLARRGFSPVVIEEVIVSCKQLGYLSDDDLTISLIERELRSGHGPIYIEQKLRFLHLDSRCVRKIVDEEKQREAIRKLYPKLRNPVQSLQRRGFDLHLILDFASTNLSH